LNSNRDFRRLAKSREDDAIAFCQLNETLPGGLVKAAQEFKGDLDILNSHGRRLVDAESASRIPKACGYDSSAAQLTTH
jgi:hypothetical protein